MCAAAISEARSDRQGHRRTVDEKGIKRVVFDHGGSLPYHGDSRRG
jgi:hypothetical protein